MFPTDTTGSERSRLQDKDPGRSGREKKGKTFERNFMKGGFAEISERELPMGCRRGMGGSLRWGGAGVLPPGLSNAFCVSRLFSVCMAEAVLTANAGSAVGRPPAEAPGKPGAPDGAPRRPVTRSDAARTQGSGMCRKENVGRYL